MLETYRDQIISRLAPLVASLTQGELVCLWLATQAAEPLLYDQEVHDLSEVLAVVKEEDIVDHLMSDHLAYEAMNYTNSWIREVTGE